MFLWRAEKGNKLAGAGAAARRALLLGFPLTASVCYLKTGKKPPRNVQVLLFYEVNSSASPFFLLLYKKKFLLFTVFNSLE